MTFPTSLLLMILIGRIEALSPTNSNEATVTCLGARRKCENDVTCKVFLDTVSKVCDESTDTCETTQRLHCISVLTTLQTNSYFKGCVCDPLGELQQYRECRRLRTLIFAHLCIRWSDHTGFNHHVVAGSRHGIHNESSISSAHLSTDDLEVTCLEAKKRCGLDPDCSKLANDLRSKCKETRSTNQCLAQDWNSCYSLVVDLFTRHRYLIDCSCPVRHGDDASGDVTDTCEKVKLKVTGNACIGSFLLSVEYKVLPSDSMTYEQLLGEVEKLDLSGFEGHHCLRAFSSCHSDVTCRSRAVKVAETCRNSSTLTKHDIGRHHDNHQAYGWCGQSNRCLENLRDLVADYQSDVQKRLVFCSCDRPRGGDFGRVCRSVVATVVMPTCAHVAQLPVPSCSEQMKRCDEDVQCSSRLVAFSRRCATRAEETESGAACEPTRDCQEVLMQLFGTLVTNRCSCKKNHYEQSNCEQDERLLSSLRTCFEVVRKEMALSNKDETIHGGDDYDDDDDDAKINLRISTDSCRRRKNDAYQPLYIRAVLKNGYCADVCRCQHNRTVGCVTMPCLSDPSCSYGGESYLQGSSLEVFDRGQCRCHNSEFICPKTDQRREPKAGLFLHLGYSQTERNFLLQYFSEEAFPLEEITARLSLMINEGINPDERECNLTLYHHVGNNIMYEIQPSNGVKHQPPEGERVLACIPSARRLNHLVNTQDPKVSGDVHLSVVKVSQLEKVTFFDPEADKDSMTSRLHSQLHNHSTIRNDHSKNVLDVQDSAHYSEYSNSRQSYYNDRRPKYSHKSHHQPYTSSSQTYGRVEKTYTLLLVSLLFISNYFSIGEFLRLQ